MFKAHKHFVDIFGTGRQLTIASQSLGACINMGCCFQHNDGEVVIYVVCREGI